VNQRLAARVSRQGSERVVAVFFDTHVAGHPQVADANSAHSFGIQVAIAGFTAR
jgi:hypothetical protein